MSNESSETFSNQNVADCEITSVSYNVDVDGCKISFPFAPYRVQEEYMGKIVKALNEGSVAALESPTGTGKTLSLLCSTLAWVEKNKMANRMMETEPSESEDWAGSSSGYFKKVVFYASRTHSQLSKAMAELRRTQYKHMRATILGSRDQMCVHPDLPVEENLSTKNAFCQAQLNAKTCRFHHRVEAMKADRSFFLVRDIEDLVAKSKKSGCCPFYMSRHLQEEAEIVFLPYNYIFDRGISRKLNLNFNGSIVILDEAHNIDRVCEEAASVSLSSTDIAVGIRDTTEEMQRIHDEMTDSEADIIERSYNSEDLIFMKEKLMGLEGAFDEYMSEAKGKNTEYRPDVLQIILNKAGITEEIYNRLESGLNSVYENVVAQNSVNNRTRQQACTLRKVADFISAPFQLRVFLPENLNSFVVHSELDYPVIKRNHFGAPIFTPNTVEKPKGITFNLWCLNPSLGMQALWNAHSVILTSGTLSPLKNVILELGLKQFPACKDKKAEIQSAEFGHVVPHEQFMIFSVCKGPNGVQLQYNFQNKDNLEYWEELGLTILNFIRLIPDGVLIFFPSYQAMSKATNCWKFKGLWDRLCAIKPLFSEETDKRRFNNAIEGYRTSVDEGKGGVLMGICRGKMSEGIDFSDQYGRAVAVCGLPYPPYYDPRVKSKMKYVDGLGLSDLKGHDWYRAEATKAVNQAIGRVIRHAKDVGVILLCDLKFEQAPIRASISAWLRPVKTMDNFGLAIISLRRFFRAHPVLFKNEPGTSPSKRPSCEPLRLPDAGHSGSSSVDLNFPSSTSTKLPEFLRLPAKSTKSCLSSLAEAEVNNDGDKNKKTAASTIRNWRQVIPPPMDMEVTEPAKKRAIKMTAFIPQEFKYEPSTPALKEKAKRMNEAKFILHELKRTIEEPCYDSFTNMLRKYQQDKNLTKFIEKLSVFFPKEDDLLSDLFRECNKFLSGEDRVAFGEYCLQNGYGVVIAPGRKLEEPPEP